MQQTIPPQHLLPSASPSLFISLSFFLCVRSSKDSHVVRRFAATVSVTGGQKNAMDELCWGPAPGGAGGTKGGRGGDADGGRKRVAAGKRSPFGPHRWTGGRKKKQDQENLQREEKGTNIRFGPRRLFWSNQLRQRETERASGRRWKEAERGRKEERTGGRRIRRLIGRWGVGGGDEKLSGKGCDARPQSAVDRRTRERETGTVFLHW